MGQDSKLIGVMFPLSVAEALERRAGAGKQDFIRAAVAEKLARDFGENLSPTLARANQGVRTDLELLNRALRDALPFLRAQAAEWQAFFAEARKQGISSRELIGIYPDFERLVMAGKARGDSCSDFREFAFARLGKSRKKRPQP